LARIKKKNSSNKKYILNIINIISQFLSDYEQGKTPNPDIQCNKVIKFDHLYNYCKTNIDSQIEYIATGHYARLKYDATLNSMPDLSSSFFFYLLEEYQ
jgi:tRNA U34 2-thiouridine synthase MnmA/TrmU